MNRRHFFKSIAALSGAVSASPLIFVPKFEPVKWKPMVRKVTLLDIMNASSKRLSKRLHEEVLMQMGAFDPKLFHSEWKFVTGYEAYPINASDIPHTLKL